MLSRRYITSAAVVFVLLAGVAVKTYADSRTGLTQEEVQNPNSEENMTSISRKLLESSGKSDFFKPDYARSVDIVEGNLTENDGQDIAVVVDYGPTTSLVGIYSPKGGSYEFVNDLGQFYNVADLQVKKLGNEPREILLIDEDVDQRLGALEQTQFRRGYRWNGSNFDMVLSVPKDLTSTWNQLWETEGAGGQPIWNRVSQEVEELFSPDGKTVNYIRRQTYAEAEGHPAQSVPQNEDFRTIAERVVEETYNWSDEWNGYILKEMYDKATNEKVAVLEDLDNLPYALSGVNYNFYRIRRGNGNIEVVPKDSLSEISADSSNSVFQVL